jgi:hypothetical protein
MIEARQPKGIPTGGQFAATAHAEPALGLSGAGSIEDNLAQVNAALAVNRSHWDAEMAVLSKNEHERRMRRRRLAGVRSAALILNELPAADVLSYTRTQVVGTTALQEVRDVNGKVIYSTDDLDEPVSRGRYREEAERRAAVREAVRLLNGTELPPEHDAQGISVHPDHEELHLGTAIRDGLEVLAADDLTPEQASAQRVDAALKHWTEAAEGAQAALRDMFTDLRHHADRHGLDLHRALDSSYAIYIEESNDPAFTEGL